MRVRTLFVIALCALTGIGIGAQESFDVTVTYMDGHKETVSDFWEYYQRDPVRELCYLDDVGKPHMPHVPYGDIATIDISEYKANSRLNTIVITLRDGTTQTGLLWGNDRFFARDKNDDEWRGLVVNMRRLQFLPIDAADADSTTASESEESG